MQKQAWTWTTSHFPQPARMARWGHFGAPVLIFPTAGGDFEEIERFQLVAALGALIDGGRIKVYSVDALAVRARLSGATNIDDRYDAFLHEDVLRRMRSDCQAERIEPLLVGASLGAGTAIRTLCRHPDVFRGAIGLSGIYSDGRDWGTSGWIESGQVHPAASWTEQERDWFTRWCGSSIAPGAVIAET